MNEDQYRRLCETCDQILLERREPSVRFAIAWLHILRAHPALLTAYTGLFSVTDIQSRLQWLRPFRAFGYFFNIFKQLAWACYRSITERKRSLGPKQKIDTLIISHMLDGAEASSFDDLYFGPIAPALSERSMKVAVAYINHSKVRPLSSTELKAKSGVRRFVLGRTTSWQSELRFLRSLIEESNALINSSCFHQGLARLARIAAAAEAFAPATLNALRIASQVETLIAEFEPDNLLTTYEGHAWERVTFTKAHIRSPKIICLAYQHSAIFRFQHAIRRSLGSLADPDFVLMAGPIAASQLSSAIGQRRCLLIGSPKATFGVSIISKKAARTAKRCIFLPEGIKSEAILLTKFCFECATAMPDVEFVLRFHPAFNFYSLLKHAPQYSKLPQNVEISIGRSLKTDSLSASWAVYRGSTAIIGAVLQGVAPVYLAQVQEMTIDPLFALGKERQTIMTVEDLALTIKATWPQWSGKDAATAHCKEIFSPFNMSKLFNVLESRMKRSGA